MQLNHRQFPIGAGGAAAGGALTGRQASSALLSAPRPLLEARPGQNLHIRLRNELAPYESIAWNGDHNVPHHLDHTNLHTHGLEVRPTSFHHSARTIPLPR